MQNDAQEISYILWDNLFTPKKLVDSSGTVVWDAALKPYGGEESILGSAVMNLRMPGQYVDEETGRGSGSSLTHPLYYNYNRDYDPATGRYTQVDPIGLVGGNNPPLC
ncbi:RHS repeat-associated core domain-containing protein [Kiloniella litopenaei]|uniref:RHS repeat-associated core domain-containing protein n=1 Tax=Kiloniella litopenaei TaxID=1549748 RepID=UPI003BAC6584